MGRSQPCREGLRVLRRGGAALAGKRRARRAEDHDHPPPPADAAGGEDRGKEIEELRAAVARHDAELARLREDEKARALASLLRFSGYVQVDAVAYNQLSQDEVDPATGKPLNQTRFLLRRGHLRADLDEGLVSARSRSTPTR